MPQIRHVPENSNSIIPGRKVYFACHPEDHKLYFDEITAQLREISACTVFYYEPEENVALDEDYYGNLKDVNLMVIPVTTRLLCTPNRAMDVEFAYAVAQHIPVLPLMQEKNLEEAYREKFGDLQYLDPHLEDPTAIPYAEKLKKYLESVLISDELAKKIRAAFDACVFLSYRKKDRKYAQELMRLLHRDPICRDIAIWYDEFLKPGENFNKTIQKALEDCKLFALTVTPSLLEKPDGKPNYILLHEYPQAHDSHKPILPVQMVDTDADELRSCCPGIPDVVDPSDESAMTGAILEAMRDIALRQNDKDPQHNFFIGLAYLTGIDVEVDHEKAVELITSAAEAGLVEAMDKLVSMYETGEGVERNYHTAIHWQERVVEQRRIEFEIGSADETEGMYWLSLIHLSELRQKVGDLHAAKADLETLIPLMKARSEKMDTKELKVSFYQALIELYVDEGELKTARYWGQKNLEISEELAKGGTVEALNHLVYGYIQMGKICLRDGDFTAAKEWYRKALQIADQDGQAGLTMGQWNLYCCYDGLGVICRAEGDQTEEKKWRIQGMELCKKIAEDGAGETLPNLVHSYHKLCDIYKEEGNLPEAKRMCAKALEISVQLAECETMDNLQCLANSYYRMGQLCKAEHDNVEARNWYQKSMAIRGELAKMGTLRGFSDLAELALDMAIMDRNIGLLKATVQLYKRILQKWPEMKQYKKHLRFTYFLICLFEIINILDAPMRLFRRKKEEHE